MTFAKRSPGSSNREATYFFSGPRNQRASGTENPCLGFDKVSFGSRFPNVWRRIHFFTPPRYRKRSGKEFAKAMTSLSRKGTRISSPMAMLALSAFSRYEVNRRSWSILHSLAIGGTAGPGSQYRYVSAPFINGFRHGS